MNEQINEKNKELLESIALKTIDTMFNDRNINVLSIFKQSQNTQLFFPEFYEMMFLKMMTQFGMENLLKIVINYEEFGLDSYKACTIYNDAIKHMEVRQYFTHSSSVNIIKRLNEHNLFLNTENLNKIKDNIDYTKREEVIAQNDKIKSYFTINDKLQAKGQTSKTRKI